VFNRAGSGISRAEHSCASAYAEEILMCDTSGVMLQARKGMNNTKPLARETDPPHSGRRLPVQPTCSWVCRQADCVRRYAVVDGPGRSCFASGEPGPGVTYARGGGYRKDVIMAPPVGFPA